MKLNVDKCEVMPMVKSNPKYTYEMIGSTLPVTTQKRDVGVIIESC